MIRPRDLHYHRDTQCIEFFLEGESEQEKEQREKSGLSTLEESSAQTIQSEIEINKAETSKNEVVYFESIMFLV